MDVSTRHGSEEEVVVPPHRMQVLRLVQRYEGLDRIRIQILQPTGSTLNQGNICNGETVPRDPLGRQTFLIHYHPTLAISLRLGDSKA